MKRKKVKADTERNLLIGAIVNDRVCGAVSEVKIEYWETDFAKLVSDWCRKYFKEYNKSPNRDIENIYNEYARKELIPETQKEIIAEFISRLSNEYERTGVNEEYLLDLADRHFRKRALKCLSEILDTAIIEDNLEAGENALVSHNQPIRGVSKPHNPFNDLEGTKAAFESSSDPLFALPGELGAFLAPFERDQFAAFMGPEKRGKTWWLIECAMTALRKRLKVAYLQAGDLSLPQVYLRFHIYNSKKHYNPRYCKRMLVPCLDCKKNQTGKCRKPYRKSRTRDSIVEDEQTWELVDFEEAPKRYVPCTECLRRGKRAYEGHYWFRVREEQSPLTYKEAFKNGRKFYKRNGKNLRVACWSNDSISIDGIRSRLLDWESRDGFLPDVVIIDYMDILAPVDKRVDYRHQQNQTWSKARALSTDFHCCVISATQADAASYSVSNIRAKNFSEDKRKYSHVNYGIITLNQTMEEKEKRIMRLGRMFVREDDYNERSVCNVIQCLAMGRPNVGSWK